MSSFFPKIRHRFPAIRGRILGDFFREFQSWLRLLNLGPRGERIAVRYLEQHGLYIQHRNWKCPIGEIDIVAQQGDTLVFIEVKTRRSDRALDFTPVDAVDETKRIKIRNLAEWYRRDFEPEIKYRRLRRSRFDIVGIVCRKGLRRCNVRHYPDAF